MNTKNLSFTIAFVFFLLLSCEKNETDNNSVIPVIHDYRIDNVLYKKNSKLKYVYRQDRLYAEYMYDKSNKISRINYGVDIYAYEVYQYNTKGELEKISSYYQPPVLGLGHTCVYSYDAKGNKVKEQIDFTDNRETVINLYIYSGGKLTKQEHYEGTKQTHYIVYEYKGDLLVKEKFYVPGEKDFSPTEYFYKEGLLVYVLAGWREERYYYDRNDNLIKCVANIPSLSSSLGATEFYVTEEYEYE